MPLWSNAANTLDAPKWMPLAGANATGANLYGNTTVGAFKTNEAVGVFGVSNANTENITGVYAPGWQLAVHGTGPLVGVTAANGVFSNGETFSVTATGANTATGTLLTNATGNLVGGTVTYGGFGFSNASSATVVFTRQKHLVLVKETGGVGTGYANTDYILVSNSVALVNGVCSISTNATGGFGNSGITITNPGVFSNATANTNLVFAVYAANGAASNGSGAVLAGNASPSTGGAVGLIFGGRAGRVTYEPLATLHMSNTSGTVMGQ